MNDVCIQCGVSKYEIRRNGLLCTTMSVGEESEVTCEWVRHRFKPYSAKELATQKRDEDEFLEFCMKGELKETIAEGVRESWIGGKKNDLVVIIGASA